MSSDLVKRNPYIGPRPFERKDYNRFFGREREASELFSLTIAHRMLLVYAQSGAGKTSLINTRLIPQLEHEGFYVFPVTRLQGLITKTVVSNKIKNIFVYNTILSLTPEGEGIDPNTLTETLLTEFLDQTRKRMKGERADAPQVLIFDQFEELFTLNPERWEDRKGFFEQIRDAVERTDTTQSAEQVPPLWIIFVMREDYIAQLDPFLTILPGKLRTRYRLERLQADAALQAITGPLFDSPRFFAPGVAEKLVQELLKVRVETNPGETMEIQGEFVEPVQLQLVCQSLWHELPDDVLEITETHLSQFSNVDQVLARFYDDAVGSAAKKAGIEESRLRAWCESVLITLMGTRGTVYQGPQFTGNIPNKAIEELENQHLIRAERRAGTRWFELTHDRFIGPIRASNKSYYTRIAGHSKKDELSEQALQLVTQGEQAWSAGDFTGAILFYENAQTLYEQIGDQWSIANTLANIGYIHHRVENFGPAAESFQKAQALFEKMGDTTGFTKMASMLADLKEADEKRKGRVTAAGSFSQPPRIAETGQSTIKAANIAGTSSIPREGIGKAINLAALTKDRDVLPNDETYKKSLDDAIRNYKKNRNPKISDS